MKRVLVMTGTVVLLSMITAAPAGAAESAHKLKRVHMTKPVQTTKRGHMIKRGRRIKRSHAPGMHETADLGKRVHMTEI